MHNGKASSNSMNEGRRFSSFHEDEARVVDVRTDYIESISRIGLFFDSHFVRAPSSLSCQGVGWLLGIRLRKYRCMIEWSNSIMKEGD